MINEEKGSNDEYYALNRSYVEMTEDTKIIFCSGLKKIPQSDYKKFVKKNKIIKSARIDFVTKRQGVYGRIIDDIILSNPDLFKSIIIAFFTKIKLGQSIDEYFVNNLEAHQHFSSKCVKAERLLKDLHERYDIEYPGLISLYEISLRKWYGYYFNTSTDSSKQKIIEPVCENIESRSKQETESKPKIFQKPCDVEILDKLLVSANNLNNSIQDFIETKNEEIILDNLQVFCEKMNNTTHHMMTSSNNFYSLYREIINLIKNTRDCINNRRCGFCQKKKFDERINILEFSKTLNQISNSHHEVSNRIKRTEKMYMSSCQDVNTIEKDLGRDLSSFERLNIVSIFDANQKIDEIELSKKKLLQEQREEIEQIQLGIQDSFSKILKCNNNQTKYHRDIKSLSDRINISFESISDAKKCAKQVEQLYESVCNTHYNIKELACLFIGDKSYIHIYDIVDCLINQNEHSAAYGMLFLLQMSTTDTDFFSLPQAPSQDEFVKKLFDVCFALDVSFDCVGYSLMILQPWFSSMSIAKNDIQSHILKGALSIIAGIGKYINNSNAEFNNFFSKYYDKESLTQLKYPTITWFITALRNGTITPADN